MTLNLTPQQWDRLRSVKKRALSREDCEAIIRIATWIDTEDPGAEDAQILFRAAEVLLDVRQALRGGRRNVRSSRHWPEDDPVLNWNV